MPVVNIKATAISNSDASPMVRNSASIQAGNTREHIGVCAVATTDSVTSTYRFARVRSSDRISSIVERHTALGGSCAFDVGVYQTAENGGAVVDADLFASAVSGVAANTAGTDVTHEAGTANQTIADREKLLWQALGLSQDSKRYYDLAATLTAVAASNGSLAFDVRVVSGE